MNNFELAKMSEFYEKWKPSSPRKATHFREDINTLLSLVRESTVANTKEQVAKLLEVIT